ncbi:hypothetical protein Leryth_010657 [Lithospermum erythrorhizon]|nr:hypothetical protein Leryth_010657 [Lithospermum erythrorhizon]
MVQAQPTRGSLYTTLNVGIQSLEKAYVLLCGFGFCTEPSKMDQSYWAGDIHGKVMVMAVDIRCPWSA